MDPALSSIADDGQMMTFTLSGVDVSIANALRRIILSEIPSLVFRTTPYEQNKCEILENTSRLNNEIIKQRLSCIPIHVNDLEIPWDKYEVEVKKENTDFAPIVVTTQDFKIKDTATGSYLSEADTKKMFPPDPITNDYIAFLRLRPKILENSSGESIHLTCKFDVGTAKEDGSFAAVSTCTYGNTPDRPFKIETVGVYENIELVKMGCTIMIDKIIKFEKSLAVNGVKIEQSKTSIDNSYDVTLEDEDYTFGKVIEFILYNNFYKPGTLTYCGFKKFHPHDSFSVIRIAFSAETEREVVNQNLTMACQTAKQIYEAVIGLF